MKKEGSNKQRKERKKETKETKEEINTPPIGLSVSSGVISVTCDVNRHKQTSTNLSLVHLLGLLDPKALVVRRRRRRKRRRNKE